MTSQTVNAANFIEVAVSPFGQADYAGRDRWLDENERQRLGQFSRYGDRRRFVASRVLLRETLFRSTGIAPEKWRFNLLDSGRWEVAEGHGLPKAHFSTAHCGNAVAVAVSDKCPVGIDLEPLSRGTLKFPVEAVLAEGERERLSGMDGVEQEKETLRLWTVKEALAKLVGLGVDLDFTGFEVAMRPPRLLWSAGEIPDADGIRFASQECRISRVPYQMSLAFRVSETQGPTIGTQVFEWANEE